MYGSKWPFLLMYGSHDMRHTGFPRVNRLSTDPRDLGCHTWCACVNLRAHVVVVVLLQRVVVSSQYNVLVFVVMVRRLFVFERFR